MTTFARKPIAFFCLLTAAGCWGNEEQSERKTTVASEQAKQQESEYENPEYYFHIFGTETDEGPGKHFPGACVLQEDHENLLLFSIHSPGHRNGGGKGGSIPPDITFGRGMNMEWKEGLEASNYQKKDFDLQLLFERNQNLIADKITGLNQVAKVRFGKTDVPVFHVEEVTKPGVLSGYHAWFRVLETNQPPYLAGSTGNLYAHFYIRNIGRTMPDSNPWTRDKVIAIYESFYTQACFRNYFEKYMLVRDDATIITVD